MHNALGLHINTHKIMCVCATVCVCVCVPQCVCVCDIVLIAVCRTLTILMILPCDEQQIYDHKFITIL